MNMIGFDCSENDGGSQNENRAVRISESAEIDQFVLVSPNPFISELKVHYQAESVIYFPKDLNKTLAKNNYLKY